MKVESKEKSKWRPLPMSTIEFNKMSTKKLHITSA
jgi:DNA topoisomerase-3